MCNQIFKPPALQEVLWNFDPSVSQCVSQANASVMISCTVFSARLGLLFKESPSSILYAVFQFQRIGQFFLFILYTMNKFRMFLFFKHLDLYVVNYFKSPTLQVMMYRFELPEPENSGRIRNDNFFSQLVAAFPRTPPLVL